MPPTGSAGASAAGAATGVATGAGAAGAAAAGAGAAACGALAGAAAPPLVSTLIRITSYNVCYTKLLRNIAAPGTLTRADPALATLADDVDSDHAAAGESYNFV